MRFSIPHPFLKILLIPTLCMLCVMSLSGCESAKETLGVNQRQVPDEFAVIKQAPLTLPPDFNLRPPRPGAPRPQDRNADAAAKEVVTGLDSKSQTQDKTDNSFTSGEELLLQSAGADKADPNIRDDIDSAQRTFEKQNVPVAKRLFGLYEDEPPASIVDAKKERQRIKENIDSGEPITKGETPDIED